MNQEFKDQKFSHWGEYLEMFTRNIDKPEKSTFPGMSYKKNYGVLGSHWNSLALISSSVKWSRLQDMDIEGENKTLNFTVGQN